MTSSRRTLLLFLTTAVTYTCAWVPEEVFHNSTEQHVLKTAVADGELGTARSSVGYDRRIVPADGYRPTYINGNARRTPENPAMHPKDVGPLDPLRSGGDPLVGQPGVEGSHNPNLSNKDVLETQHTTCQVTTEQLVASAQATVTRVLKGLCTSQEMEGHFRDLMDLMTNRLNELKDVVTKLDSRVDDYNEALKRGKYQQMETLVPHCDTPKPLSAISDTELDKRTQDGPKANLADLDENEADGGETSVREAEIQKYNSTIHVEQSKSESPKKVFTYYWKIRGMHHKLTEGDPRRSIRSQSFFIYLRGYRLYLRCYPRQNSENFYVHVGITKGDFDQELSWPFHHKMRVTILDQTHGTRMFEDIASRVWDPSQLCSEYNWQRPKTGDNHECVGLGFAHDVLKQRSYISGDSLILKLTVYLD